MSAIEVKDERKRASGHIKNIVSAKASSLSDSDEIVRVPRRKKTNTGVSNYHKSPKRSHDRHHGKQRYCVLFKKARMPKRKCMLHSTEDFADVRTKRSIKDEMGGPIGSSNHAVQQHKKSGKNVRRS